MTKAHQEEVMNIELEKLLRQAAKAAGVEVIRSRLEDRACRDLLVENSVRNPGQNAGPWNAWDDDGDALRLGVKLGIDIEQFDDRVVTFKKCGELTLTIEVMHEDANDPAAATRHAIVALSANVQLHNVPDSEE
jgi:hypothetical protein